MKTDPIEYLTSNGWREYQDAFRKHARCFVKRYDTPTRCQCNDDKPGLQVCIAVYSPPTVFELELSGELPDGTWYRLLNYSLPGSIKAVVLLIPSLLTTWETICATRR